MAEQPRDRILMERDPENRDQVMEMMNQILKENETLGIAPNDGSGDFTGSVNKMEGNPYDVPLEVLQSESDAALMANYIKMQGSVSQDLGQLFERVRAGGVLSAMEREAFTEILKNVDPSSTVREGEYQFPDQNQVGSPRGDYEMNEDMKRKDPSSTVRQGEMLGFLDEVIREGE